MIKFGLTGILALTILILGLTLPAFPPDPSRDPVPDSQKVAHSIHCAGCHGYDETGQALVDHAGNDVNIFDDWQISMMGLSALDPFWRATLNLETALFPTAQAEIESTCLRCHAPLGSIQSHLDGFAYSYEKMLGDSLGLDGVSCSACHQQPEENLGKGHSGFFTMDTNRIFFGHYPNPFLGPMQIYVGFEPRFSDHIYSSGICAGCHTLITETLDDAGTPTGNFFVEQATYHEWLNSVYPAQGKECQTCHMPFIKDGVIIATDLGALEERHPYGLHQFFGANTAMLSLMKDNKETLDLPKASSDAAWDESIENNRTSLKNASSLSVDDWYVFNDTLYVNLNIRNNTGHKLPSGYPSRLAWLQVVLTDSEQADTIYANGLMDDEGHITGRDHPFEPHIEISKSDGDVQIYELVMRDLQGHLTTRLNSAAQPLKDNRLLPLGFQKNHLVYDTVAIWGNALTDPDYDVNSTLGGDQIEYRIPLDGRMGSGHLRISMHYQALPSRWMNDLFAHDSIPEVNQFKNMYADYKLFDEVMNSISIDSIDLGTSSTYDFSIGARIQLYPNPLSQDKLHINYPQTLLQLVNTTYRIVTVNGTVVQIGKLSTQIELKPDLAKGLYYFIVETEDRVVTLKPFFKL